MRACCAKLGLWRNWGCDVQGFWVRAMLLAGAVALAGPGHAQSEAALDQAEAARARLDLPEALAILTAAIEAAPDDAAPLVARAGIHRSMRRPSLALADLGAALELAPEDADVLVLRAETWRAAGAFDKAAADYGRARALRPDDAALAADEAAMLAESGRKSEALAGYARAVELAPDDAALTAARDALLADLAEADRPRFVYDPEALMGAEFTIDVGDTDAPNRLIVVRDGAALAAEGGVAPDLLARAVAAGAVRITHVFTYSGRSSTIWANLALICAGPALGATEAALISGEGRSALEAVETSGDTEALRGLIAAAYALGGQEAGKVEGCALDRGLALRYLADWTSVQERIGWRGDTYLDRPPVYVLNDKPVAAGWLDAWLAAQVPAEAVMEDVTEPVAGDAAPADETAAPDPVAVADAALAQITLPDPVELPPVAEDDARADEAADGDDEAETEIATTDPEVETATDPVEPAPEADPEPAEAATEVETGPAEAVAQDVAPEGEDAAIVVAGDVVEGDPATLDAAEPETETAPDPAEPASEPIPDTAAEDIPETPETDPATDTETDPAIAAPEDDTRPKPRPQDPEAEPDDGAGSEVEDVRLATALKGIWAPSLAQCLAYLEAIETPTHLDQAMPDPAADPPLGALLITSRRAQPFDGSALICVAESFAEAGDESDAVLSCRDGGAEAGEMRLHARPSGGPSPWLDMTHGAVETPGMRQCLTLGQLGVRFADLWQVDKAACTARAPLTDAMLEFQPKDGALWLTLRLGDDAALADPGGLAAAVDDVALTPGSGVLADGAYSLPLGPFDEVAHHLSVGMFLFVTPEDTGFPALRLPLLGSGRAMAALEACAGE